MAVVLTATPGDPTANSFLTAAEYVAYAETAFEPEEADNALANDANLIMATRVMVVTFSARRQLMRGKTRSEDYYLVSPTWTGVVATATQALPWPRIGMYDRNGNAISSAVIPADLKNATAELARQLKQGDRTADNDVALQGITSVKAGSVSVTFKDLIETHVLPDAVLNMLVPSWLTDEISEGARRALFEVV